MYEDLLNKLNFRVDLLVEVDGKIVLNKQLAELLKAIDERGSILSACKSLGMSYSRAWESIAKIERLLGVKVIKAIRGGSGGGGARLTNFGKTLVQVYFDRYSKTVGASELKLVEAKLPELFIVGSHDPLLERVLEKFRAEKGLENVEFSWIGSAGGLSALMLGEADVACIHLYDPETGTYNIPYLRKYWLDDKVIVVRGYDRELVFAYPPHVSFKGVSDILEGRVRIVNRILGSGTRVLFDIILEREARRLGIDLKDVQRKVKGYNNEVKTHYDVARCIVEGRAEVGLTLRFVAELYGLKHIHVCWEKFDFVVRLDRLNKPMIRKFLTFLRRDFVRKLVESSEGYRMSENMGKVVYPEDFSLDSVLS
ncbi:MAG: hypothetical protein DRJ51_07380 [Thermoprotei archaeon]|nr:MAG: hypothetical protein DRJ51_07380 [Thermoprotei archaeon]